MKAFELSEIIKQLMCDTGRGGSEIQFLTEDGDTLTVDDVVWDHEVGIFYIRGELAEDA